ncbi:hypothetical protein ACLKA7_014260 [Drosophila subpalustris]
MELVKTAEDQESSDLVGWRRSVVRFFNLPAVQCAQVICSRIYSRVYSRIYNHINSFSSMPMPNDVIRPFRCVPELHVVVWSLEAGSCSL